MARKKRGIETEKPIEPPMTPMIDVIFQLLIFFILTMKFKQEEGKLLSQLPKDKGLASSSVPQPELQEVRIVICCAEADQREFDQHTTNKGRHEANLEHDEQGNIEATKVGHRGKGMHDRPHIVINDVCVAYVEKNPLGRLYKTWVCKDNSHVEEPGLSDKKRAAENRTRYKEIAVKTKELYDLTPSSRDAGKKAPVILDADSAVPYEHIVGIVNACKELGMENVEFVGNARHGVGYGTEDPSQFGTYREQKQRK
ncbi:MAG: biopolymer transporter ExbD [Planctomycetes bacterium]|nr:biopolymer transporter ExbD [Planctomycetota bacterium]